MSQTPALTSKESFVVPGRGQVLVVPTGERGQELFDALSADMKDRAAVVIDQKLYLIRGIETMGRPRFATHLGVLVKTPARESLDEWAVLYGIPAQPDETDQQIRDRLVDRLKGPTR